MISVKKWLDAQGLEMYNSNLQQYTTVQDMLQLKEKDLFNLGIQNSAHRARLISSLVIAKESAKMPPGKHAGYRRSHDYPLANQTQSPPLLPSKLSSRSSLPANRLERSSPSPTSAGTKKSPRQAAVEPSSGLTPEKLKKDLEMELRLNNDDIRSHAWFHGRINRQVSERLVTHNSDFLVRDCISQPGDYVLTCRWNSLPLHFIINKVVLNPDTPHAMVQYQFEKESFDSIPALVRFYVGNRRGISETTGAVISRPINRVLPLSYTDSQSALADGQPLSRAAKRLSDQTERKVAAGPPLPISHRRGGSQPLEMLQVPQDVRRSDPSLDSRDPGPGPALTRSGSEPLLSPKGEGPATAFPPNFAPIKSSFGSDSKLSVKQAPPPKPSRTPSLKRSVRPLVAARWAQADYSELDSQEPVPVRMAKLKADPDQDSPPPRRPGQKREVNGGARRSPAPMLRARKGSDTRFSILDSSDYGYADGGGGLDSAPVRETFENSAPPAIPRFESQSVFQPAKHSSHLLPPENKPLEISLLGLAKNIILAANPVNVARHMTKIDLEVTRVFGVEKGGVSGPELLILPQGKQLRQDILERYHCFKYWTAITVLTCIDTRERLQLIHQWIQIANALQKITGNLYGFSSILEALRSNYLSCLAGTWSSLRKVYPEVTATYESRLKQLITSLNRGSLIEIPLSKTCIPHLVPAVKLLENDFSGPPPVNTRLPEELGEKVGDTLDLDYVLAHIEAARCYPDQTAIYTLNGQTQMKELSVDPSILEVCRTEFQMRALWGSRGVDVHREERYHKFEQILQAMSNRISSVEETL